MLLELEILFYRFLAFYFQQPKVFAIPLLIIGLAFMIKQWFNRNKTFLPGFFGLVFLVAWAYFQFSAKSVYSFAYERLNVVLSPGPYINEFSSLTGWLCEPLFSLFVAPYEYRHYYQEAIFIAVLVYLALVIYVSIQSYKKDGLIIGALNLLQGSEEVRPSRSEFNELGSGDLAGVEHIGKWTRATGKIGDTTLAVRDLRGASGVIYKTGNLVWPREERNRHMLAVAKTGSGKTSRLILPVLYNDCMDKERSTIVIDAKPEMWNKLAMMTRKYNPDKRIILFNPLDMVRSLSWNILAKIEDDTDCKLIANTIVMATDNPQAKSDSPFFRNNALALLNSIMVGLLNDPNDVLSMPRVHELIQSGMRPLCDWLEAHPNAYRTSRTFVELARSGSQNADTIMSELGMRVNAWDLKTVRATTAFNEINLQDLIDYPTLFILEFRESEIEMLRPLANVVVIEMLRFLTKSAEKHPNTSLPRPVGLVIDEFASALGRLPDIHIKLNTLRSRNVSIVGAIQSIAQVKANYGDDADSVLAGFSTKIFMPALDIQDSEWASKETGQMTIRFQTESTGSNRKIIEWFASKNISTQEQVQQRAVLTPDEIGRPKDGRYSFFLPNTPPFQGFLVPFYEIPKMLRRITEFEHREDELKLRKSPIEYAETISHAENLVNQNAAPSSSSTASSEATPAGITDTGGMSDDEIKAKIEEIKKTIKWEDTTGSAKKWWETFETQNEGRPALVLRVAEELKTRNATITEFFLAYVYSNTDNIQANLHYLDYSRLKKEEEERKRQEKDSS